MTALDPCVCTLLGRLLALVAALSLGGLVLLTWVAVMQESRR